MNVEEVRVLFERSEKATDPEVKFEHLQDALDLSDDLIAELPEPSKELDVLRNVRHSYIRRLLAQLTQVDMRKVEIDVWLNYTKLLFLRVQAEVETVLQDDPALSESYNSFIRLWGEEFIAMAQRRLKEL